MEAGCEWNIALEMAGKTDLSSILLLVFARFAIFAGTIVYMYGISYRWCAMKSRMTTKPVVCARPSASHNAVSKIPLTGQSSNLRITQF